MNKTLLVKPMTDFLSRCEASSDEFLPSARTSTFTSSAARPKDTRFRRGRRERELSALVNAGDSSSTDSEDTHVINGNKPGVKKPFEIAPGSQQRRRVVRKRMEYCRDFHYRGLCQFGQTCRYVHTRLDIADMVFSSFCLRWYNGFDSLNDVTPHFLTDDGQHSAAYQSYFFLRTEMIPNTNRRLPVFANLTSGSETCSPSSPNVSEGSTCPDFK